MLSLAVLLLLARTGFSQSTNATCLPEWKWSFNSLNQSPCVVASWLAGACINDVFNIAALEPDLHYVGPANKMLSTPCVCSSVTYALVSACGMCQGQPTTQQWSSWTTNCSNADIKTDGYAHVVPEGTLIPQWAFIDIPKYNMLDLDAAQAIANQSRPDIGPNGAVENKKSVPIGAIVGGVLGGLLVLGIAIACIVWFCLRRKRAHAEGLNKPVYDPDMTKQPGFLSAQPTGNAYSPGSPTQNYSQKQTYDPPPPNTTGMFTAQQNVYAPGIPASPTSPTGVAPVRSSLVYSQPQHLHSMPLPGTAVPDASAIITPYNIPAQGGHGGSSGEVPPAHPASFYNVAAASQYGTPQGFNPYQQPAAQQHAGPYARHPEV